MKSTLLLINLLVLSLFISSKNFAQCVTVPSFSPGAIVESFEGVPTSPTNPSQSGGLNVPVTPFTFSSGVILTAPSPNSFGQAVLADWSKGPASWGICNTTTTAADVPGGTASLNLNNSTDIIGFTLPSLSSKVGLYVEGAPCAGSTITLRVYNASNVLIGTCTTTPTGMASNWRAHFIGFNSASTNISRIEVDGPYIVLDMLTFENCVSVTCPGNLTANNTAGLCNAVVNYTSSSTGTPAPAISYTFTGATTGSGSGNGSGSTFNRGVTTVTLTATNTCGTASCSFTVTVVDNQAPVINCIANIVACGSQVINYTNPTATDNCSATVTQTAGLPSGSVFPVGTTVNTFVATDPQGNTASCSFNVIINPIPDVAQPANQVVCNNTATAAVNFTGSVTGTVFNWANNTTSIGLAASGTGNIASFTAINTGAAPVVATVTVTPSTTSGGGVSNLILNGDFETGNITGWTNTVSGGANGWNINNGTLIPPGGSTATPVIAGGFDVVSTQSSPGLNLLSSLITLPASFSSSILNWKDRIMNYNNGLHPGCIGSPAGYFNPQQQFRVELLNSSLSVITTVFSTNPGDPYFQAGPNIRNFNVTAALMPYAGQQVYVRFSQEAQYCYFNVTLDDIKLMVNSNITCTGTPKNFTITVNPTPNVAQPANQVVCNNFPTAAVNFTGTVPGTIFNWTNNTSSIGLAASGTGNIASFTATNATTNPVVATIIVTPSAGGSSGAATFNYTGAIQTWTVPAGVTSVNLNAVGAQGGSVTVACAATGGLGARMRGDFAVTPGEVLSIMVGQQGLTNGADAGGGGGTFIVRGASTALLVAGGGGGASNDIGNCGPNRNGVNATITTSGTASGNGAVAGGTAGNGGGASNGSGGGGGGFLTDGVAGSGLPGNNGKSYLNGGAGGNGNNNDFGGYGGGGAGWFTGGNGGGGGGYSGGGTSGSQPFSGGGGGGSFNGGTNQVNAAAVQTGNGQVIITYGSGPTCTGSSKTFTITVNPTPAATIVYAGNPYCQNAGTATVTRTGTAGGTYSSTAGLVLNATTGDVTLGTSTAGTYTVTYTIPAAGGCAIFTTTTSITITALPAATIVYAGNPYCQNAGTATVTRTGTAGGTYSSTAGLVLNATTGDVTLGTSTAGTYTVTYTIPAAGGCAIFTTTTPITITALPAATIVYPGTPYCQNAGTATVTRTGTAGGTYSSTAGLTLNAATGDVTLVSSTAGTYTVTYTIAASGGCPAVSTSTTITITATPAATIVYAGTPYCSTDLTAPVTRTGTAGGTYSSTAGLTLNTTTGTVTPNTSTPGTYTVTYMVPAGGGCAAFSTTTTITITQAPNAIIFYFGTPYCANAGTATVSQFGTAGGTYSASPAGLTINATTGAVTLGTSIPGTYTVTYTMAASGGCGVTITTTTITITPAPAATISYAGSPYCQNAGVATVTQTGTAGGTYSSTAGLTINATTGAVTLGSSTPGTYTVTYTVAASGGCATYTTTTTITITALPVATISYAGSPYCQNAGTATVTRTGAAGGTYSSTAGLTINATTGDVTLGTSTAGTYTVSYTVAAGGGCPAVTATTSITVSSLSATPTGITASSISLCGPTAVTLTVTGGSLGTGATWRWYSGTCGNTAVGTGASITITVNATTTYFVRAEGTCNTTTCASVTVTVNPQPTISIAASGTTILPGQTTTLTATVTPANASNTTVWFRNGIVVPGATGLTLVVNIDGLGVYTARTTTSFGCTALSNGVTITTVLSSKLWIYPNPNNGRFSVRFYSDPAQLGFRHLVMFAANGQKVYDEVFGMTAPYSSIPVNATNLAKGIYTVMITDAANNKVLATGKVVIQ